jgi:hypothetical protein
MSELPGAVAKPVSQGDELARTCKVTAYFPEMSNPGNGKAVQ